MIVLPHVEIWSWDLNHGKQNHLVIIYKDSKGKVCRNFLSIEPTFDGTYWCVVKTEDDMLPKRIYDLPLSEWRARAWLRGDHEFDQPTRW